MMNWIDNLICLTIYSVIVTLIIVVVYYIILYMNGEK